MSAPDLPEPSAFEAPPDEPWVRIEAEWTGTGFRGRLTHGGLEAATWVDPQAAWPAPTRDLDAARTWPGRARPGRVTWTEAPDGSLSFETTLPRRYGDLGSTRAGAFANGAWYPQPLVEGRLPSPTWEVRLRAPDALGVIVGGQDEVPAERVAVALVPRGTWTPIGEAWLLTRGRPRRALVRGLEQIEGTISPDGLPLRGAIVEAPLRRRLVRAGPGLVYVSDRAFRLSPGLQGLHLRPVARGVAEAWVPLPGDFEREVAAASLVLDRSAQIGGVEARRALRPAAWLPMVDAMLHDRRLPFVGELLGDAWPGDPLEDDLVEHWMPATPGAAVVAQAWDAYGLGPARSLWRPLVAGVETERAGVPSAFVDARRAPMPSQDYRIEVHPDTIAVHRDVENAAPAEPIVLRVDGVDHVLQGSSGPGLARFAPPDPPRRVALDPERHLQQRERAGDTWPGARTWLGTGYLSTVNLDEGWFAGSASVITRPKDNTRREAGATVYTSRDTRIGLNLGLVAKLGQPIDGLSRAHRLRLGLEPAWLDPSFAPAPAPLALGLTASWRWDTRVDLIFPVRGRATVAYASAGFLPGTDARWRSMEASWTGLHAPHPRWVLAGRVTGGIGAGEIAQRLPSLGGPSGLRSVPANAAVGEAVATAAGELRWAPVRGASLPLGALWATELHLAVGAEAGVLRAAGEDVWATGLTTGVVTVGEWLGVTPAAAGITVGWPLRAEGVEASGPTAYLRWGQAF